MSFSHYLFCYSVNTGYEMQCPNLFILLFRKQIWVLETFPNGSTWWHKKEKSIPRCAGWADGMKFQKPDNETLFYSVTKTKTIEPTPREMKSSWWISSQEYFEKGYSSSTSSDEPIRKKRKVVNRKVGNRKRKEVTSEVQREVHTTIHREVHVRKEIHRQTRQEGFGEASISDKIRDMARDFGDRMYAIEQRLGIAKVISLY